MLKLMSDIISIFSMTLGIGIVALALGGGLAYLVTELLRSPGSSLKQLRNGSNEPPTISSDDTIQPAKKNCIRLFARSARQLISARPL